MPTLYLNNSGDKWVEVDENGNRDMRFILVMPDGTRKIRKADYYESFGNFYSIEFRIGRIKYGGLPETFADEETGLPIVSSYVERGKRGYK